MNWHIADLFNCKHDLHRVQVWSKSQFGPPSGSWDPLPTHQPRWMNHNNSLFRFRDEKDYMLFVLRWA